MKVLTELGDEFRRMAHGFNKWLLILVLIASGGMVYGFTQYVPPLEKAKEVCMQEIYEYPLDQFMPNERAEINELKASYEVPVSEATTIPELDEIKQQFIAELADYPTREDAVNAYVEQLQEPVKDIYSKKDRKKANELVEQFKKDAMQAESEEEMYNLYSSVRQKITTTYRTKEQVDKENAEVSYLIGTWHIPNSYEFPFTLYSGGTFEMAITDNGKNGLLSGTWVLDGSQVYIYITSNSLNPGYKAFTWVFDYNTVNGTLEGTGDYFGWIYYRM